VFKNNIRGDPYSKDYRYIKIAMKKCVETATTSCKDAVAIKEYFNKNEVQYAYLNTYLDKSAAWIVQTSQHINYEEMDSERSKHTDVFLQKG